MIIHKSRQIKESNQIDFVISLLKRKTRVTSIELKDLGIAAPSAIIWKLRQAGYNIITKLVNVKNSNEVLHQGIAEYSIGSAPLVKGGGK